MEKQIHQLRFEEKQEILSSFPNIKLCYDNINHNKVEKSSKNIKYDLCCAIPCGKKCFSWFIQLNGKNVCLILELVDKKHIVDIKIYSCVFNNELIYGKYGTIFYGTLFHYKQTPFFAIEDIFYYKGNDLSGAKWFNRLTILKNLFENEIKQIAYNKNFIVFGLPLIAHDTNDLKRMIDDVQYKIFNIQFRSFDKENTFESVLLREIDNVVKTSPIQSSNVVSVPGPVDALQKIPKYAPQINNNKSQSQSQSQSQSHPKNIVFKIKADIQNDIYHLYCMEDKVEVFYNIAYIPDYRTSVMMNKIFRNIKENENLDFLEESDDEEEFQNEKIDRFVDINKTTYMICKFNHKFKKWYPVKEVSDLKQDIVEKNELLDYEKNNYTQQQYHNTKYNQKQNKTQFYSNKPTYRK